MTVTELLARFANPEVMQTLSASDKLYAGVITTILGMGITFSALIILQFIIGWMNSILNKTKSSPVKSTAAPLPAAPPTPEPESHQDDSELVAVIATAIAMKMKTSVGNIVIKNIEKIEGNSPPWNRAGIVEQMNSRF